MFIADTVTAVTTFPREGFPKTPLPHPNVSPCLSRYSRSTTEPNLLTISIKQYANYNLFPLGEED